LEHSRYILLREEPTRLKKENILLFIIVLSGAFLRIYDLDTESLWLDEGISILWGNMSPSHVVEQAALDVHPPLYFLILHYWITLFGDSAFSVRLLSAIIGIISLFMIFRIGSSLFGSEAGLLSALIMAISEFHIWYSQDARPYSLLVLMSLLSVYTFIQLHRRRTRRDSIGYIISSSLLIYTHYFGFFIVIAQNIFSCTLFFLKKERIALDITRWFRLQGLLLIPYLPWSGTVLKQLLKISREATDNVSWIAVPSFHTLRDSLKIFAGSYELMYLYLTFAVLALAGYKKKHGSQEGCFSNATSLYLLMLWFTIPIILPGIISFIFKPIYETRYAIAASLAFYIITAQGIHRIRNRFFKSVIVVLIIVFSSANVWKYYERVDKQQWREVAGYIENNAQKGDFIIFMPGYTGPLIFNYYSTREDVIRKRFPEIHGDDLKSISGYIPALAEGKKRVWFVVSFTNDLRDVVKDEFASLGYNIMYHGKYDGNGALPDWGVIEMILFEKRS